MLCALISGCHGENILPRQTNEPAAFTPAPTKEQSGPANTAEAEKTAEPQKTFEAKPGNLSNKTVGWGFRPIAGARPEFTKEQMSLMDKYGCIDIGNAEDKSIYLTFDEGYENGYTAKILDTLKKHNVPAAFFITEPYLKKNADLVDRMVKEGHIVGNHTVNHPSLPSLGDEEIERELLDLDRKFFDLYGKNMKYLRPPMGEYSERTLYISKKLGYTNVFWSFAYRDWETDNQKGANYALEQVKKGLYNGAVLLLHAVSKDNAEALESIIEEARNRGYVFKSLDEFKK